MATRSYLYVEDVAEAFDIILHKGSVGHTYNIGTQKERTVSDVARDIAKIFNLEHEQIVNVRDRAFNDRRQAHLQLFSRQFFPVFSLNQAVLPLNDDWIGPEAYSMSSIFVSCSFSHLWNSHCWTASDPARIKIEFALVDWQEGL